MDPLGHARLSRLRYHTLCMPPQISKTFFDYADRSGEGIVAVKRCHPLLTSGGAITENLDIADIPRRTRSRMLDGIRRYDHPTFKFSQKERMAIEALL